MNSRTPFALKGDIVHTPSFAEFTYYEDAYLVCQDARVAGIYRELPGRYRDIPVADHTGSLIIPGMCDMHLHAPQYPFRGWDRISRSLIGTAGLISTLSRRKSGMRTWTMLEGRMPVSWEICSRALPHGPVSLPLSTALQRSTLWSCCTLPDCAPM